MSVSSWQERTVKLFSFTSFKSAILNRSSETPMINAVNLKFLKDHQKIISFSTLICRSNWKFNKKWWQNNFIFLIDPTFRPFIYPWKILDETTARQVKIYKGVTINRARNKRFKKSWKRDSTRLRSVFNPRPLPQFFILPAGSYLFYYLFIDRPMSRRRFIFTILYTLSGYINCLIRRWCINYIKSIVIHLLAGLINNERHA